MKSKTINKILIPIDGSEYSMRAVDCAIEIAKEYNSTLLILYVLYSKLGFTFHNETAVGLLTPSSIKKLQDRAKEDASKWFEEIIEKCKVHNVQIKTLVDITVTSVVEEILNYAEQHNTDMIILGSKGRSGFKKLVLGSVASGISTYSHCPVLIIK